MSDLSIQINPLAPADLKELETYWQHAHPHHPMDAASLRERLFDPPGAAPDLLLAARDSEGRLAGIGAAVAPAQGETLAGLRWLSVAPELAGRGVEARLLEELCARLAARGANEVRTFATPPYYIRPGVDTRDIGLLATLLDLGWTHIDTNYNMTVDLAAWRSPGERAIFGPDSDDFEVRRAQPADGDPFAAYLGRHWRKSLKDELWVALHHEPPTLFLAWHGSEVAGFAAYEANQCLGVFGPTGVTPELRGKGLGRRLLDACLLDLKRRGLPACEIGWVGPVAYYHRACAARLGPAFWVLSKGL